MSAKTLSEAWDEGYEVSLEDLTGLTARICELEDQGLEWRRDADTYIELLKGRAGTCASALGVSMVLNAALLTTLIWGWLR